MWQRTKHNSKTGFDKLWSWADKLGAPVNRLSNRLGSEAFWPTTLDKESDKAARILRSFCSEQHPLRNFAEQRANHRSQMTVSTKKRCYRHSMAPSRSKRCSRRSRLRYAQPCIVVFLRWRGQC